MLDEEVRSVLVKVSDQLKSTHQSSINVPISEKEAKIINTVLIRLRELGYKTSFEYGYWEDRPCGGYVDGKLTISW